MQISAPSDDLEQLNALMNKLTEEASKKHKKIAAGAAQSVLKSFCDKAEEAERRARRQRTETTEAAASEIRAAVDMISKTLKEAQTLRMQALAEFGQHAKELQALAAEVQRAADSGSEALATSKKQYQRQVATAVNAAAGTHEKALQKELESIAVARKKEVRCRRVLQACGSRAGWQFARRPLQLRYMRPHSLLRVVFTMQGAGYLAVLENLNGLS